MNFLSSPERSAELSRADVCVWTAEAGILFHQQSSGWVETSAVTYTASRRAGKDERFSDTLDACLKGCDPHSALVMDVEAAVVVLSLYSVRGPGGVVGVWVHKLRVHPWLSCFWDMVL